MSNLRPFEPLGMTTTKWLTVPVVEVEIEKLTPCQDHLADNWTPGASFCNDPHPHVVGYNGKLYLSDGHNRTNHQKKQGSKTIKARLLYKVNDQLLVPFQTA